jgi:protein arginine kinase activator
MICERCHNTEATVHLTEIIKDVRSEVHLCDICAKDIGFSSKLSDISTLISFSPAENPEDLRNICSDCGTDIVEISENGRAGCPRCYTVFSEAFSILCGEYHYAGSVPNNRLAVKTDNPVTQPQQQEALPLDALKRGLSEAVTDERYEDAAHIRDLIKTREGSVNQ